MKPAFNKHTGLIFNKHTIIVIGLTILAVIIGGSSTYWLSLINNGGGSLYTNLGLLGLSFIFSTIPDSFAQVEEERAQIASTEVYYDEFIKNHKDLPEMILDKKLRNKHEPWFTSQGNALIGEAQGILYKAVTGISSFVTDAIIISFAVDPWFAAGYSASAIIFLGGIAYSSSKLKPYTIQHQQSKTLLSHVLLTGWENIAVGNQYNYNLWSKKYKSAFDGLKESLFKYTKFLRGSSTVVTIITCLPLLGVSAFLSYRYAGVNEKILLIAAIVPRQFKTMTYVSTLSNSLTKWVSVRKKLKTLDSTLETRSEQDYRISWDKIVFSSSEESKLQFDSPDEFTGVVLKANSGRFTIRGENTVGKSVLMCKLKLDLTLQGKSVFFLPTNARLYFENLVDEKSAGERMLLQIGEIEGIRDVQYILLDEWDANLSYKNMREISERLLKISERVCVVEIRHRSDEETTMPEKELKIDMDPVFREKDIVISFNKFRSQVKMKEVILDPAVPEQDETKPLIQRQDGGETTQIRYSELNIG